MELMSNEPVVSDISPTTSSKVFPSHGLPWLFSSFSLTRRNYDPLITRLDRMGKSKNAVVTKGRVVEEGNRREGKGREGKRREGKVVD